MRFYSIVILIALWFTPLRLLAQHSFSGQVIDEDRTAIPYAVVFINDLDSTIVTDLDGQFSFTHPQLTRVDGSAQALGKKLQAFTLVANQHLRIKMRGEQLLNTTTVSTTAQADSIKRSALHVNSIPLQVLSLRSTDLSEALAQSAGVKIQTSGGNGSATKITLNGLSNKAVRIFVDGIPIEQAGIGLSQGINTLPIDLIERIDVYKGVVPIELGSDVLGGAINLVSKEKRFDALSLAHESASFGTFKSSLFAQKTWAKHAYSNIQLSHVQSANDYMIDASVPNELGQPDTLQVRRFHDGYTMYGAHAKLGLRNTGWAQHFSVQPSLQYVFKEIQHPFNSIHRAVGDASISELGRQLQVGYKGQPIRIWPLKFNLSGHLGHYTSRFIDSSSALYDWTGTVVRTNTQQGELGSVPFNARIETKNAIGRWYVQYQINSNWQLNASATHSHVSRVGEDTLVEQYLLKDPFANRQMLNKHISGLATQYISDNEALQLISSIKYFANSGHASSSIGLDITKNDFSAQFMGFNLAAKYQLHKAWSLKASFEQAARLPDENELFGDGVFIYSNPELVAEQSANFNLGLQWTKAHEQRPIQLAINGFRRSVKNQIHLKSATNFAQYVNIGRVLVNGFELEAELDVNSRWNVQYNCTYQDLRNRTDTSENNGGFVEDRFYNARIPNTPIFFQNVQVQYTLPQWLKPVKSQVYYRAHHTPSYFLFFAEDGLDEAKLRVPKQFVQDLGWSIQSAYLLGSLSFEVKNWTNQKAIDSYGLQKPGRSWHIKYRFNINQIKRLKGD